MNRRQFFATTLVLAIPADKYAGWTEGKPRSWLDGSQGHADYLLVLGLGLLTTAPNSRRMGL